MLGLLHHKYICYHNSHSDTLHLYKMLVRPLLEYASCVWDPYLRKDINNIEKVQAFALKICLKEWYVNHDALVETASIPTLENGDSTSSNASCIQHNKWLVFLRISSYHKS